MGEVGTGPSGSKVVVRGDSGRVRGELRGRVGTVGGDGQEPKTWDIQ